MNPSPRLHPMDAILRLMPMLLSIQCFLPFAKSSMCLVEPELHQVSLVQIRRRIIAGSSGEQSFATKHGTHTQTYERVHTHTDTHIPMPHLSSIPPILYLKTHKTGSSTLTGIIHRMGDRRNLTFMLPKDAGHLGYPGPFPGKNGTSEFGLPQHQYDVICNHAVLNTASMYAYLKPRPHLIISLREPSEQMISTYYYYELFRGSSFDDYLQLVNSTSSLDVNLTMPFMRQNMQAYDMGWYEFVGGTTGFDNDQTKIREWLAMLDSEVGSVVLSEYFDEGLVLWRQKMQVDLEEMVYVRFKTSETREDPTEGQYQRLAALSDVDRALYGYFSQRFWQEWFNGTVSKLEADVESLKRSNEKLQRACDESDSERCPPCFTMNNIDYTAHLKMKQIAN